MSVDLTKACPICGTKCPLYLHAQKRRTLITLGWLTLIASVVWAAYNWRFL